MLLVQLCTQYVSLRLICESPDCLCVCDFGSIRAVSPVTLGARRSDLFRCHSWVQVTKDKFRKKAGILYVCFKHLVFDSAECSRKTIPYMQVLKVRTATV